MEHPAHYRVLYRDIDSMGVLYYGRYLALFEMGRVEWLRAEGFRYRDLERDHGLLLPVTEARCRYRAPLAYDDLARVRTRVAAWSRTTIRFAHVVERAPEGPHGRPADGGPSSAPAPLCAEGEVELACVDAARRRPARLPDGLTELLRARVGPPGRQRR